MLKLKNFQWEWEWVCCFLLFFFLFSCGPYQYERKGILICTMKFIYCYSRVVIKVTQTFIRPFFIIGYIAMNGMLLIFYQKFVYVWVFVSIYIYYNRQTNNFRLKSGMSNIEWMMSTMMLIRESIATGKNFNIYQKEDWFVWIGWCDDEMYESSSISIIHKIFVALFSVHINWLSWSKITIHYQC